MNPARLIAPTVPNSTMDRVNPAIPSAATGRRPHLLDLRPQYGLMITQRKAEREKMAPAVQAGSSRRLTSSGRTAVMSMVLPAPTAISAKKRSLKAPLRLSDDGCLRALSICLFWACLPFWSTETLMTLACHRSGFFWPVMNEICPCRDEFTRPENRALSLMGYEHKQR